MLFYYKHCTLVWSRNAVCIFLMWSHRNIFLKHVFKGVDLIKLITFTASSRTMKWNWHFSNHYGKCLLYLSLTNIRTTIRFRDIALIHAKAPAVLLTIAFASSAQMSTQWKRRITSFIIVESLILRTPWKGLRVLCGSVYNTCKTSVLI